MLQQIEGMWCNFQLSYFHMNWIRWCWLVWLKCLMVSKSFFLCYQIHDTSFTEFLFTWREKRQDIVPEPLIQEEHLGNLYYFCDHCLRFNLMIIMIFTVVFFRYMLGYSLIQRKNLTQREWEFERRADWYWCYGSGFRCIGPVSKGFVDSSDVSAKTNPKTKIQLIVKTKIQLIAKYKFTEKIRIC